MRRVSVQGWIFMVAVPLIACSGAGAGSSNVVIDATADAPIDGRPPNTVVGRRIYVCHGPSGDLEAPGLNHFSTIEAWIPDASASGYRIAPGLPRDDGTFTIPDVPDGMLYLLRFDDGSRALNLFASEQPEIELRIERGGRCTADIALDATPVDFALTGMTPYSNGFASGDSVDSSHPATSSSPVSTSSPAARSTSPTRRRSSSPGTRSRA
jgi:hypothetical protein